MDKFKKDGRLHLTLHVTRPDTDERATDQLNTLLLIDLEQAFADQPVEFVEPPEPRSGDPITAGLIALALLPVVADRLIDLIVGWLKRHEGCSITLQIPDEGGAPMTVTYDPERHNEAQLREWIAGAKRVARDAAED